MRYDVTIYIKDMQIPSLIPHAFLGLTHTHPDKLEGICQLQILAALGMRKISKSAMSLNSAKPTLMARARLLGRM